MMCKALLFFRSRFHYFSRTATCLMEPVRFLFNETATWVLFQADVDGNGTIDYIEFITATMHMNRMEKEDHLYKAFEYFDEDRSG